MTIEMNSNESVSKRGIRGVHILWIILGTILLTAAVTYWTLRTYIYAKDFKPVTLNANEAQTLDLKLKILGYEPEGSAPNDTSSINAADQAWLKPERYSEAGAQHDVDFNERELNALLAKNTDLAKKLAVDLSDDLVSARLLLPVDRDFPVLGGKTLRLSAGVELAYRDAKPIVVLKGVSVMGIPIPNAWLGGLKNIDLIQEFGDSQGFWSSFSAGVDNIHVAEGKLKIRLKE